MLESKSLTQLRALGQSLAVKGNVFEMDKPQLLQAIQIKQQTLLPEPKEVIPLPAYDARLMRKTPARLTDQSLITEILQPYVDKGLKLSFPYPEQWRMTFDKREDTGTLRQAPRVIVMCAARVLNG